MRKYWYAVLLAVVCLLCVAFNSIAGSEETVRDSGKYLQVDPYVKEQLDNYYAGLLMDKNDLKPELAEYYYYYTNKYLGDPAFVINLEYQFDSESTFEQEWSRVEGFAKEKQTDKNRIIYSADSPSDDIKDYLDDQIHDGQCFYFEFAIVDPSAMTISYLTAMVQDNQSKKDVVLKFINQWDISNAY